MLSREQEDERSVATADDSPRDAAHSNAVGLIMRRPDYIGISLRSTTADDSPQDAAHSNVVGQTTIFSSLFLSALPPRHT
ncbi:MAG: hypothetical protein WDN26_08195 [Chitinophagaceae bacterium]